MLQAGHYCDVTHFAFIMTERLCLNFNHLEYFHSQSNFFTSFNVSYESISKMKI